MEEETTNLGHHHHYIFEILRSFFDDCLLHPELLLHEKLQSLRNFIQQKEEGIFDTTVSHTNIVSFPLNCYQKASIGTQHFSSKWCRIKTNRVEYGQLRLKWEPISEFLSWIEGLITCCNQEATDDNMGALFWMMDFLDRLKLRTAVPSEVEQGLDECKSSNGDLTTEYSTSSVASGSFLLNGGGDEEKSDREVVYVTPKDLKTLEKSIKSLERSESHASSANSSNDSLRSSSEEKTIPNKQRDRSSSPEIIYEKSKDPLQSFYIVSCCSHEYRSLKHLYSHLCKKHKIGLKKAGCKRCKLCGNNVNNQLVMLHIELYHEFCTPGSFKILIRNVNEGELEMELVKLS